MKLFSHHWHFFSFPPIVFGWQYLLMLYFQMKNLILIFVFCLKYMIYPFYCRYCIRTKFFSFSSIFFAHFTFVILKACKCLIITYLCFCIHLSMQCKDCWLFISLQYLLITFWIYMRSDNEHYFYQDWEYWMLELLSIACLSIAIKLNEISGLSLHEILVTNCHYIHHSLFIWYINCMASGSPLIALWHHVR